ncbi:Zinc finger BED domain-containing protein RICESLEEPER 3 [Bienertia sinuspersici]
MPVATDVMVARLKSDLLSFGTLPVAGRFFHMLKRALEAKDALWGEYSTLLAIAIVLDPRYTMVLVKSTFSKLYVPVEVEARVKEIYDALDLDYSYVSIGNAQSNVDAYLNSPLMAHNSKTPFDILEY